MKELTMNEMQQVGGGWAWKFIKNIFKPEKLGDGSEAIPKEWQERASKGIGRRVCDVCD